MATESYYEEQLQKEVKLIRQALKDLPPFINELFVSLGNRVASKTRLAYAYDLKLFFNYILENSKQFKNKTMETLTIDDLGMIESEDIDLFLEYITYYEKVDPQNPDKLIVTTNDEKGKVRKLAAIRTMFKFFYKKKKIKSNPAALVEAPKIHDKTIVRLDINEMCDLLDEVEYGTNLSEKQQQFHKKTQKRDLAIISLLVGTGMRVSECVGINKDDISFNSNGIKVRRKGGNEVVLYFGDEVRDALIDYLEERKSNPQDTESALFLSLQGTRIGVRAVQNLVKKYSNVSVKTKNISPHKLRSTYGTNLYQATGDIYLVANTLGHADVNTTRRHYAEIEENARRSATSKIKLRRD